MRQSSIVRFAIDKVRVKVFIETDTKKKRENLFKSGIIISRTNFKMSMNDCLALLKEQRA
jgi:hypothetical protein